MAAGRATPSAGRLRSRRDHPRLVRPDRPPEHARHLRGGCFGVDEPGAGGRRPRHRARVRGQPPRHGGRLRRLRAPAGAVAGRPPPRLLPRHQDGRAHSRRRPRRPRALAPTPRRRPRRSHPAAQPGRGGRVGGGPRPGRRRRGPGPGEGRGVDPVHRRHRPRDAHRSDAPAQPRALRLRLGPAALQLHTAARHGVPGRRRGRPRHVRRAERRRADHQGRRPPPLARRDLAPLLGPCGGCSHDRASS